MKENLESNNISNQEVKNNQLNERLDAADKNEIIKSQEVTPRDIEKNIHETRQEVLSQLNNSEKASLKAEKQIKADKAPINRRGPINRKQINDNYKKTIKQVQSELSFGSKIFSKITHNPVIEKVSDVVGSTVAKPNALLSGAVLAFIFTLLTYVIAKKTGYELSGFETIGAFFVGWIIGLVFDYLKTLFTGKK